MSLAFLRSRAPRQRSRLGLRRLPILVTRWQLDSLEQQHYLIPTCAANAPTSVRRVPRFPRHMQPTVDVADFEDLIVSENLLQDCGNVFDFRDVVSVANNSFVIHYLLRPFIKFVS